MRAGATTRLKTSNGCAVLVLVSASVASRVVVDSPRITYHPRQDATPQSETAALASVYKFVLDNAKKKAATHALGNDPDDAEEFKHDRTTVPEYTQ